MLDAGSGDDVLTGGADNDTLFGGGGADTFVFDTDHGQDTILDFAATDDWLALSSALVGGLASGAEVLAAHAMVTEAGVAFDFGAGNTILLQGVTSLDGLDQRIEVFGDMLI
jgi:Ca2+-binding RTX toxin-like protein